MGDRDTHLVRHIRYHRVPDSTCQQKFKIGPIVGFQSHDYDDAQNSDGGQGMKNAMDEMEESPYCTTLHTVTRERYKQNNQTYVERDP